MAFSASYSNISITSLMLFLSLFLLSGCGMVDETTSLLAEQLAKEISKDGLSFLEKTPEESQCSRRALKTWVSYC